VPGRGQKLGTSKPRANTLLPYSLGMVDGNLGCLCSDFLRLVSNCRLLLDSLGNLLLSGAGGVGRGRLHSKASLREDNFGCLMLL
jgi:hypothetical protein